jgi:GrpB-like predicted nucleotidyltransferase (UPF0157 family)
MPGPVASSIASSVKRDLARRTWRHVQHYADAKTAIVEEIMARATAATQQDQAG